jgi:arylsulfatase A-like enzyme
VGVPDRVPLIVSGPLVSDPNRDVDAMVNVADLFQLFGEVAGVDVHQAVPARILPM